MFVCSFSGGSIRLCVQSVEALYVCVYSHGGSIRLRFQSVEALYVCVSGQ